MKKLSCFMVILGATFWGIIGIFVKGLYDLGFSSIQISFLRVFSAAIILSIYVLLTNKKAFKIKFRDIYYFIGTGIISIVIFNYCYFVAIKETSLSVAAILLYTAPSFVTVFSYLIFKEKITLNKLISLILTFLGCILVTGYFDSSSNKVSTIGLFCGIGSGIAYALYSIFGKLALKKYSSMTVTLYSFILATIGAFPLIPIKKTFSLTLNTKVIAYTLGLGLFSTVLAFLFYTIGLENLEPSKASILATVEPVVATLTSLIVFKQPMSISQIEGIMLVICALLIVGLNKKFTFREKTKAEENNLEM
ncbi:DMT family transporter [Hathewaya massiliensis]|uniref:DMT family transporter n=1 Tax=Hathewaya massiliensis TaxID=1964382 RepID=UPI00115C2426|nr:EamA family transporter [Hathewaya massiliensis]